MNKSELLSAIASVTKLSKEQVNSVLNKYAEIVAEQVITNKEFVLLDLGKIVVTRRSERKAFNPSTREPIVVPEADVPRFKFSRGLKQKVADAGKK